MITVECDGQDITPKLKEHRVHSVLFANIPSFSSGEYSNCFTSAVLYCFSGNSSECDMYLLRVSNSLLKRNKYLNC